MFHPLCNDLFQRSFVAGHRAFCHFQGVPGAFDVVITDGPTVAYGF